jgi:uncharacterized membrane protein
VAIGHPDFHQNYLMLNFKMTPRNARIIQQQLDEELLRLKLEYQQIPFWILSGIIIACIMPFLSKSGKSPKSVEAYKIMAAISFLFLLCLYLGYLYNDISSRKQRIKNLKMELEQYGSS